MAKLEEKIQNAWEITEEEFRILALKNINHYKNKYSDACSIITSLDYFLDKGVKFKFYTDGNVFYYEIAPKYKPGFNNKKDR